MKLPKGYQYKITERNKNMVKVEFYKKIANELKYTCFCWMDKKNL